MNQLTLTDIEYSNRKKKTKREEFLDAMEQIIPWKYWADMIRPYYFNNKRGRKPIGIETMLRMYLMQIWFNLSDEGIEDAIYDSYAMRSFMHIDFNEQQVPDATTLLKFRHMLEKNKIGEKITKDLSLNEKQTADFMKEWKALFPKMDGQAEMPSMEEMQKKFENFDKKLKEILTEEQYKKYHEMIPNREN